MTKTLTRSRDRSYWRMCDTDGLINAGRDSMDELAIAMAERLADYAAEVDELDDVKDQLEDAQRTLDALRAEIADLTAQLDAIDEAGPC